MERLSRGRSFFGAVFPVRPARRLPATSPGPLMAASECVNLDQGNSLPRLPYFMHGEKIPHSSHPPGARVLGMRQILPRRFTRLRERFGANAAPGRIIRRRLAGLGTRFEKRRRCPFRISAAFLPGSANAAAGRSAARSRFHRRARPARQTGFSDAAFAGLEPGCLRIGRTGRGPASAPVRAVRPVCLSTLRGRTDTRRPSGPHIACRARW